MESIRPSSDLRNKYPDLMGHAQYGKMKAELELLSMLVEAQDDVNNGRTAPMQETFDDIRKALLARKTR